MLYVQSNKTINRKGKRVITFITQNICYRSGSYCRLHESIEESGHSPQQNSSGSQTTRTKSGQRFNEDVHLESIKLFPSYQNNFQIQWSFIILGRSIMLPPPIEGPHDLDSSTIKRNTKPKLTTFKNPEAQIMGSPPSSKMSSPSPPSSPKSRDGDSRSWQHEQSVSSL